MATNRDDFSPETKRRLALRVGYQCSFEGCEAHTVGPSDEALDAVSNVGFAAHIAAAAPGGKRYDANMTPEQRSSIDNGIWMCGTHAKLIDTDEVTWTVARLHGMKDAAEARAKARIGTQTTRPSSSSGVKVEGAVCVYIKSHRAAYVAAMVVNEGAAPVTIKSVELRLGAQLIVPNKPRENLFLEGCDWFSPGTMRLNSKDAELGAWFFGWSFAGGGSHVEAAPGARAELTLVPVGADPIVFQVDFVHPDDAGVQTGATTRVRSTAASGHLDHDRDLFRRLDALLPEVRLVALADRLQTDDDYTKSEVEICLNFRDAVQLESNRFCEELINGPLVALSDRLGELLGFLATNCFVYPDDQPPGSDTQYALYPELNIDRGGRVDEKASARYRTAQADLDRQVAAIRDAYIMYRAMVRRTLAT